MSNLQLATCNSQLATVAAAYAATVATVAAAAEFAFLL